MKRMKERLSCIMLCAVIAAGLIPLNALVLEAAAPADQIGNHYQADQQTGILASTPELSGDTSKSYADDWLRTNKTISPGENENEFLITLEVRTKAAIENVALSEDAATVIVVDLSGSMNDGNKLLRAKEAAQAFIHDFSQTEDTEALRKIAVVGFSGQQEKGGSWGNPRQEGIIAAKTYQPWTDANDASVSSAIDGMDAGGGTCLQAGLVLARNLLDSGEVENIISKNIVVLTDGCPTYYLTDDAASDTSIHSVGAPQAIQGSGSNTDHSTHTKTETTAKDILDTGIHVYSIFLGNDTVSCNGRGCGLYKTGAAWLRENCGFITYAVDEADSLSNIFESISELIQLQAKAWIAEDPMGEMFDFSGFQKHPPDENEYFYNSADEKIQWNLRLATPDDTTEDGFSIYRLTYKVRLNTLAPSYMANQYYPANGTTSVTWLIEKSTESGVSEMDNGIAYFNVPSAKGYAADISFRKEDGNGQPLAGAEFRLYHEGAMIATATSDSDGTVLFENVPSGHSYTIVEESAPEGFIANTQKYNIEVAYGNLIGTIGEDNTVINVPERKYGGLTVSKIVSGAGANPEEEFSFTVALSDAGISGVHGDLEFTDGVARFMLKGGESVTASDLLAGICYTVTENGAEGYTTNVNGESGSTATGTIPADDSAFAAFHNFYEGGRIEPEPEYGCLIISKTISGDGASQTDEFVFTLTLDNAEINGNYGDINFINGVARFILKGGESMTASGLPAGICYTVTENEAEGYTPSVNGKSGSTATGTIPADSSAFAAFHNFYEGGRIEPEPEYGGLIISKTISGDGASQTDEFVFTVTLDNTEINGNYGKIDFTDGVARFTLKGGESVTASGLPAGTGYTVTENEAEGYTVTVNGENRNSITGDIETGKLAEIAFNNYKAVALTPPSVGIDIMKTVQATGDIIPDWENIFGFVVSRNLPDAAGEAEIVATPLITITGTGTDSVGYEFDNLEFVENSAAIFYVWEIPQDTLFWKYDDTVYRVTFTKDLETGEVVREYARITGFGDEASFEPVADILFTNVYHYEGEPGIGTNGGDLTVSKTVSKGDRTKAFTFTVTLDDPKVNGKYGDLVFTDGVAVLLLKDGESATAEELPANVGYTVRESDNSGYAVTVNGTNNTIAEGKIIENETAVAAFTNEDTGSTSRPGSSVGPGSTSRVGNVKVTKTVTGNKAPSESTPYSFRAWIRYGNGNTAFGNVAYTIKKGSRTTKSGTAVINKDGYMFSLKDGESISFNRIPAGRRFEVQEVTKGDFTTTVRGLSDGSCTIQSNATKEVEFINDYGNSIIPPSSKPSAPPTGNTPSAEDVPPPTEDAPPPTEDVPPSTEDVPPSTEDVPPPIEDVSPPTEDALPPTEDALPPSRDKLPPAEDMLPQTGDSSHLAFWITLFLLSLFGMIVTVFFGKRRLTRWKRINHNLEDEIYGL